MNRRGFSLAEVVVAVVLFSVGILALTRTSGAIARMTGLGRHASASATLASSRLERLRAEPCLPGATAGSTSTGQFREGWTVAPAGPGRALRVIINYGEGLRARADTYETRATCGD